MYTLAVPYGPCPECIPSFASIASFSPVLDVSATVLDLAAT
jgi:hypothetical protein